VSVYTAGEVDGLLYYVMPFVEGRRFATGSIASTNSRSTT
jgi:hypothetical protein